MLTWVCNWMGGCSCKGSLVFDGKGLRPECLLGRGSKFICKATSEECKLGCPSYTNPCSMRTAVGSPPSHSNPCIQAEKLFNPPNLDRMS